MTRNVVAAQVLSYPYFTAFVDVTQPFGVIFACFIGCFFVTGGWFSHKVRQGLKLLSLLVCGRPTSTTIVLVSSPL